MKPPPKTRNARLEARVPSDQKALFQRAATLRGQTLSEFVIGSTQEAADKVIQDHELIRLSRDEQIAFVKAVLAPQNLARACAAVENYRKKSKL